MNEAIYSNALYVVATGFLGIISYLIKSYFARIHKDITCLGREISKLEGRLDSVQVDMKNGIIELTRIQSEIKAAWRFIDGSHQRASDS